MPRPKVDRPAHVPVARSLADQLRGAMTSSGLSPAALARAAGVDPAQVLRFLSGERDVRLETAGRLCDALGLHLQAAARAKGRPKSTPRGPTD